MDGAIHKGLQVRRVKPVRLGCHSLHQRQGDVGGHLVNVSGAHCAGLRWQTCSCSSAKLTFRPDREECSRLARSLLPGARRLTVKSSLPGALSWAARSDAAGHVAQTTTVQGTSVVKLGKGDVTGETFQLCGITVLETLRCIGYDSEPPC